MGGVERGGHRCHRGQVMKDLQFCDLKFRFNPVENSDCILKITAERVSHCRIMGLDLSWKHTTAVWQNYVEYRWRGPGPAG